MNVRIFAFLGLSACGTSVQPDAGADANPTDATVAMDASDGALAVGPIQCRKSEDCVSVGPNSGCFVSIPGGLCVACDLDGGTCPMGTICKMAAPLANSACLQTCMKDPDCNIGLFCNNGVCWPRSCADGGACPSPYECNMGRCERPKCVNNTCPGKLVCNASMFCVEP